MNSVVVNFFGGPCAGKTVLSWNLAVRLKRRILAEVMPEYAKFWFTKEEEKLSKSKICFRKQNSHK